MVAQRPAPTGATERDVALLRLLAYLGDHPAPDQVIRTLVTEPLALLGIRGAALFLVHDHHLTAIGNHGFTEAEYARYKEIPTGIDMPLTRAVRDRVPCVVRISEAFADFPAISVEEPTISAMVERLAIDHMGGVAITADGRCIGAISFASSGSEWDAAAIGWLASIAAALGLWLSHPDIQRLIPFTAGIDEPAATLNLTDRQREILRLIASGRSNMAIAAELGFSNSLVKQEIQRILRSLRASTRSEAVIRARELALLD